MLTYPIYVQYITE